MISALHMAHQKPKKKAPEIALHHQKTMRSKPHTQVKNKRRTMMIKMQQLQMRVLSPTMLK